MFAWAVALSLVLILLLLWSALDRKGLLSRRGAGPVAPAGSSKNAAEPAAGK